MIAQLNNSTYFKTQTTTAAALPGPRSGIRLKWTHYQNTTPTFELTSIEKPDLSPFLTYMTGKNTLIRILRGRSLHEDI
ncbi:MAG: hypothetical protein LBU83_11955, partial [Bacteroidales bacterium]|nr:hypothetical protein [Bacteroidales bacterium]